LLAAGLTGILLVVVQLRPQSGEFGSEIQPVLGIVEEELAVFNAPAELQIRFDAPIELVAPGPSGRVTRIHTTPGDVLGSGDPVLDVGGTTLLAVRTEAPFWRSLSRRSKGPDVVEMQCALRDLGFLKDTAEFDGTFGTEPLLAVRSTKQSDEAGLTTSTPAR